MTDQVQIELIRTIPATLGAVGGIAAAWFAYKSSGHSKDAVAATKKIEANTDGLTEKLVALTGKSSRAQGNLEGRAELKEETGT